MAGAIRLTQAEREVLAEVDEILGDGFWDDPEERSHKKSRKAWSSFIAKVRKSEAKAAGLDVKAAVEAFRGVLGSRLILPMGAVWGMMQNRIRALGLTEADCTAIAKVAAADWAGRIKAESLVRQAEKLLSEGQTPGTSTPRGKRGALDMDDL